MSVVCVTSAHGSPGVTTTALVLAATWPSHRRCLVVEADPFGGVIAARYGIGDTPGLSSLAAGSRRSLDDDSLWLHSQPLPGGVPVVVGAAALDEARAVLDDLAPALADWFTGHTDVDVIIDCGRVTHGAATGTLMGEADVVLVLTRPTLEQLRPAAWHVASLNASGLDSGLVLVGDRPYGPTEVTVALGTPPMAVVAWDPRAAAVLTGSRGAVRDLRRSRLVRSVSTLAQRLVTEIESDDTGTESDRAVQDQSQEVRP